MTRYIPQRDASGAIIGMVRDDGSSQVASLLEETLKAVGAAASSPQTKPQTPAHNPHQTIMLNQTLPKLDTRVLLAVTTLGMFAVLAFFSLLNQPTVTRVAQPTVVILPRRTPMPTDAPLVVPAAPTPAPAPQPEEPQPAIEQPSVIVQPQPEAPAEQPAQVEESIEQVPSTVDTEATADTWVEEPISTPTSLPQPGEPGFVESFKQPSECSPFLGYVGEKKAHCDVVYAEQTAQTP